MIEKNAKKMQAEVQNVEVNNPVMVRIAEYFEDVKNVCRNEARQSLEEKNHQIREAVRIYKQNNPDVVYSSYLLNLENIINNQQPSMMINIKEMQEMEGIYDKWFHDIRESFRLAIRGDEKVVEILNEIFD